MGQRDLFLPERRTTSGGYETKADLDQWFTPCWAAEELAADVLNGMGDVAVLEPSCGAGHFLSVIPSANEAYGVDVDPLMAAHAARLTGREVIVGDFAHVDLPSVEFGVVLGNPPFASATVDAFVRRCHDILPDEGRAAFVLPAHLFSTTARVSPWSAMFSMDVKLIPRSLFPRISLSLVWARFTKTRNRTISGLMLFRRQQDVESMSRETRTRLHAPGTWREAVHHALEALDGEATLKEIYLALEPRRPSGNRWWRDKCRQVLGLYFERVDETRWRLPTASA